MLTNQNLNKNLKQINKHTKGHELEVPQTPRRGTTLLKKIITGGKKKIVIEYIHTYNHSGEKREANQETDSSL